MVGDSFLTACFVGVSGTKAHNFTGDPGVPKKKKKKIKTVGYCYCVMGGIPEASPIGMLNVSGVIDPCAFNNRSIVVKGQKGEGRMDKIGGVYRRISMWKRSKSVVWSDRTVTNRRPAVAQSERWHKTSMRKGFKGGKKRVVEISGVKKSEQSHPPCICAHRQMQKDGVEQREDVHQLKTRERAQ